ncbi:hypothetical protein D4R75_08380 [bacterium]|nr:MAG: hypothetical protein D4R75_08380 [bacterium]
MKYVEFVNSLISRQVGEVDNLVLFGQNIMAGSCLGGLCKGLNVRPPGKVINTQNSENTLIGVGFGLMQNQVSSILFMKQQDFLLLGVDHLVNTYNIIRANEPSASFTIMPIVVDSGYEGPQSALNNFSDFCSIANIGGYCFTNKRDTETIVRRHLVAPGFRILGVSQRLMKLDVLDLAVVDSDENGNFFKYTEGDDVTIVCFNYSLPYALEIERDLRTHGKSASLFSVNTFSEFNFGSLIGDVSRTRSLLILDDSKSGNQLSDRLLSRIHEQCCRIDKQIVIRKTLNNDWFYPSLDHLNLNVHDIVQQILEQ